jgi:chromosome segregation ATPase
MKETLRQQQDATSAAEAAAQGHAASAEQLRGEKAALEQQATEMQRRIRDLVHQASEAQQEAAQEAAASARLSEQLTEAMHRIDELTATVAAAERGAANGQRALAQRDAEAAAKAQQKAALQEQLTEAQGRSTKDAELIATLRQEVLLSTAREQATSIGALVEEVLGILC